MLTNTGRTEPVVGFSRPSACSTAFTAFGSFSAPSVLWFGCGDSYSLSGLRWIAWDRASARRTEKIFATFLTSPNRRNGSDAELFEDFANFLVWLTDSPWGTRTYFHSQTDVRISRTRLATTKLISFSNRRCFLIIFHVFQHYASSCDTRKVYWKVRKQFCVPVRSEFVASFTSFSHYCRSKVSASQRYRTTNFMRCLLMPFESPLLFFFSLF